MLWTKTCAFTATYLEKYVMSNLDPPNLHRTYEDIESSACSAVISVIYYAGKKPLPVWTFLPAAPPLVPLA